MASDRHSPSTQAAGSQGLEVKPDGIRADGGSGRQAAAMRSEIVSPDGTELSRLYNEHYFQTGCGPIPYDRTEPWLTFFGNIAEQVIRSLRPRKVLDAGCAMGFLVESFWDRGVEAWGIDISPYAISRVRPDMRPFCAVGSLTDPLQGPFDIVVCTEVIEHIPSEHERTVAENLCAATSTILFSSTPSDFAEATHFNVRPLIYWLRLFSEFGFWPDLLFDTSFVAPHAMLLRKSEQRLPEEVLVLFAETLRHKAAIHELNTQLGSATSALQQARGDLETVRAQEGRVRQETVRLKQALNAAERRLSDTFASPGWRVIERYRGWVQRQRRLRPRLFNRYERVALWALRRIAHEQRPSRQPDRGRRATDQPVTPDNDPSEPPASAIAEAQERPDQSISRFLLIISGCPGDAYRYRVEHQAEELRLLGLSVEAALFDAVDYTSVITQYSAFVLHRVPHTSGIEQFIDRAKRLGKPVIFDTDDLIFSESFIGDIKAIRDFAPDEYNLYIDGVRRYHRTLSQCAAAIVTTEPLRDRVKESFPDRPVYVNRNAVSDEMLQQADFALEHIPKTDDGLVRILYMSGTSTHNDDFAQCVPALARILEAYPNVRLMIVGHLDVPERLRSTVDRLEISPFMPWQELPALMRRADINLAPLELNNAFTECKSELKYFEAGLLELPTVASDLPAYRVAITHGENGFLCRSEQEWFETLERLALDPALRRRVGSRARTDVLARYTTRSRAPQLATALRRIFTDLRLNAQGRLSVAIVMRAPIAQTGGGYRNIFALANHLAARGHDVHLYVEAIAHLEGMNDAQIVSFCHRHFGESAAQIHVGHDQILASDIAVATNWPTAYAVTALESTRCKAYLVQDFEPDFYDRVDPAHELAERTYDLPLRKITLGKYLQKLFCERDRLPTHHIPFSIDSSIYRNLNTRPQSPVRVLFFARPGLKRRAYPVGVKALRILARACPEVEIAFYGMVEREELGFAYQHLGELSSSELAREMNRSHIHLSFSLTNISWVPFEAMACGCAVVEARVPTVESWMEGEGTNSLLVDPEPRAVADALITLVRDAGLRKRIAANGEKHVARISSSWEAACAQFESILLDAVFKQYLPTEGALITSRDGRFDGKIFYVRGGRRRWVQDLARAGEAGLRTTDGVLRLSDDEIAKLPLGGYVPRDWTLADWKSPPATAPLREIAASRLTGSGLEFGAGDNPFPTPLHCEVRYVDRLPQEEFAAQYHPNENIDAVRPDMITGLCQMEGISNESVDFVIACHVLEHTANPLLALRTAYLRLKPGGQLVLVIPDKRYTFDRQRELTPLEHLILDYESPSPDRDRQHWQEWYTKAFPVSPEQIDGSIASALERDADIHYHTWTYESFTEMVEYARRDLAPWSAVWSHPVRRNTEEGIEFYFVLTK
jgi:glycosyltransferase involved in cell wall biosynthesis/2-polyprenyl-3-methyl-5-hydroxy-6-metoxy-1,4-benzoquinol methylase